MGEMISTLSHYSISWGSLIVILNNLFVLHQYLEREYVAAARDSLLHDFLTINVDQRIKAIPYSVHMLLISIYGIELFHINFRFHNILLFLPLQI